MKKKSKSIDDTLNFQEYDRTEVIDEKSTLCIKNGRPTNYRYNKEAPEYPYCVCELSCIYKEKYYNNKFICKYFSETKQMR